MEIALTIIGALVVALLGVVGFAVKKLIETVSDLTNSVAKIVQWIECKGVECKDHWLATNELKRTVSEIKQECEYRRGRADA